ncbi:MAG: DUF6250 domain-containing protein [Planctomycetota bacterium]|jgi:hypothetical protein
MPSTSPLQRTLITLAVLNAATLAPLNACAQNLSPRRQAIVDATLRPYTGPSVPGVDTSTLTGKVMSGYQGWFSCEGDGAGVGWRHYSKGGRFEPGACTIDLWPDMSELDPDEKFATPFKHADGSTAHVFSSYLPKTVNRHFRWMREHDLDGVFVQRFASGTLSDDKFNRVNTVLANCRAGANANGRAYALMYDLSGMREGQIDRVIDDFKLLVGKMGIGRDKNDKAYLHHKGKPVVAVWGLGFKDRRVTPTEWLKLIRFMKDDRAFGGFTVMLGVPTGWRRLERDCIDDPVVHDVIRLADIVSPWTVGRYRTPDEAREHAEKYWAPDRAWCDRNGKDYLPVVFPGFSWHNLKKEEGARLGQIPRLGGRFLWAQYAAAKQAGATMVYQAMFDEVDEGTAIFKCTNNPPLGASPFLTYENYPTDHYLWLVGQATRMIRGQQPYRPIMPTRTHTPPKQVSTYTRTLGGQAYKLKLVAEDNFDNLDHWTVETTGRATVRDNQLVWDCTDGAGTIWFNRPITGPTIIEYDAVAVSGRDNLNFIPYASQPDGLLETTGQRTGDYSEYHKFPNYIVTYLSDEDGKWRIRFRRNPGFNLLTETFAPRPPLQNKAQRLTYVFDADGLITFYVDGRLMLEYRETGTPIRRGRHGFRTWRSLVRYANFKVYAIQP